MIHWLSLNVLSFISSLGPQARAEAHFLTDQQQLYSFGIMKKTAAVDGMESGSAILRPGQEPGNKMNAETTLVGQQKKKTEGKLAQPQESCLAFLEILFLTG